MNDDWSSWCSASGEGPSGVSFSKVNSCTSNVWSLEIKADTLNNYLGRFFFNLFFCFNALQGALQSDRAVLKRHAREKYPLNHLYLKLVTCLIKLEEVRTGGGLFAELFSRKNKTAGKQEEIK